MELAVTSSLKDHVRRALEEDLGSGDATSLALTPDDLQGAASIAARQPLALAGVGLAREVFRQVDSELSCEPMRTDGDFLAKGETILRLEGKSRSILSGERTALNYLQRLSGVATLTRRHVEAIPGFKTRILDTRKTTPGWRELEKYAVRCGGGENHRMGLFDMIMIKDNHLAALKPNFSQPIPEAVARARRRFPDLKVEVEADDLHQALAAAEAGADRVLLDNMTPDQLKACVDAIGGRCETEASGGVRLENLRELALTGVDFISVGALTHSAIAVDIALDFDGG